MRILAADIGGTNARFALYEVQGEKSFLLQKTVVSSQENSFEAALRKVKTRWPEAASVDAVSIAAAGPVDRGFVRMTNAAFNIDVRFIEKVFPKARIYLLNDFEAQAWALSSPNVKEDLKTLFSSGEAFSSPVRTVIGAGTGFGTGWLYTGTSSHVIASELGHIALAFDKEEEAIERYFEACDPGTPITIEHILSGKGLTLLHAFFTGKKKDPAEITAEERFASSPTCATFSRFYGRAARTAALAVLTESIVIGGGMARKCPALVTHENFLTEFLRYKGPHLAYLKRVRLYLDEAGDLGLKGALFRATQD